MDAEERITTLILHGAVFMRRPDVPGNDAHLRFIFPAALPPNCRTLMFSNGFCATYKWRWMLVHTPRANVEIPWDTGLIAKIGPRVFTKLLASLTR
jgi:hypothetical protein